MSDTALFFTGEMEWNDIMASMSSRITIADKDHGYNFICSGYLVEGGKVLLVLHNRFNRWVPPGGHVEAGELFSDAACREFREETGLTVEALTHNPGINFNDDNATALPLPFYVDLEREGFPVPAVVHFFWVKRVEGELAPQFEEVDGARWFSMEEIDGIETFEQVRFLAKYALLNHPSVVE